MKHLKSVALLAAVAAATTALTGTASADKVTSSEGEKPLIEANQEGGPFVLVGVNGFKAECDSELAVPVQSSGVGLPVSGAIAILNFVNCKNEAKVEVKTRGTLIAHATGVGGNAVATSTGAIISVTATMFGTFVNCVYTTNTTHIGTLTGTTTTKATARIDVQAAIPRTGGSLLCGAEGTLTGKYIIETPMTLNLDVT